MKRTKALLFLTLALCAALLTGCRSNVPSTTDSRVDGTEPSALIPTAASEIMTEPPPARKRFPNLTESVIPDLFSGAVFLSCSTISLLELYRKSPAVMTDLCRSAGMKKRQACRLVFFVP